MSREIMDVTFVVTKSNAGSRLFETNFAASPCLKEVRPESIIVQDGFPSAAIAYNDAIEKAGTDLIVFAHQDVYFPEDWLENLRRSLQILESSDPDWGVLGCWGVKYRGMPGGYLYSVGLGLVGKPFSRPIAIDTLDEFVLILRKSSQLRFDPGLPHFHMYGTDICMSARRNGKTCYAIPAFSIHNTSYGPLSREFFQCYRYMRDKWRDCLPIETPCIRIERWNQDLLVRRFKHICFRMGGRADAKPFPRIEDPRSVLRYRKDLEDVVRLP